VPADPALAGRKVLVVDDDVRHIFVLTGLLESQKLDVLFAETGAQGLGLIERDPAIDAVLMDVSLPDMDGLEAMRAVRRSPERGALPIIAVTGRALPGDAEACLAAGASDYVPKPMDPARLVRALKRVLAR
jgi:CheY-like chemotaxis protein